MSSRVRRCRGQGGILTRESYQLGSRNIPALCGFVAFRAERDEVVRVRPSGEVLGQWDDMMYLQIT